MKEKNGITLIALVITIIVLLILAGVSIAMLTGDNGILTQANEAKTATEQGKVEEMVSVAIGGLQAEFLGDRSKITPQKIAEQVNKDNNRTDVTASSSTFPTEIIFGEEGLKVPVDMDLNVGDSEIDEPEDLPIYSEDIDESQIAPTDLFDFEIIQETASNAEVASTGMISSLPQKEARITRIKPKYANGGGYNPDTNDNYLTNTNYEIEYEGITDTLIIPYQVEIEGEMYKITEVNLSVLGKKDPYATATGTSLPSIENIIYPNTVKKIITAEYASGLDYYERVDGMFYHKEIKVKKVILSKRITEIPNGFFSGGIIENIEIPSNVTTIGDSAFSGCSSLTNIKIPEGVTEIDWGTFSGCSALTEINIPSSVTTIGDSAFSGCSALTEINIPSSVISIGYAFYGCDALKTINIAKPENSIEGAPWDAPNATINWNYQGK